VEDYADSLDDEGKDYLARIRAGAQRMGVLIDEVLLWCEVVDERFIPRRFWTRSWA
jgi:hypothetical protein